LWAETIGRLKLEVRGEFSLDEYLRRTRNLAERSDSQDLDAIITFSHANIRYLTGFHTFAWMSILAAVVRRRTLLCVPDDEIALALATSCADEVLHFPSGEFGPQLFALHLRGVLGPGARVGIDMGMALVPPPGSLRTCGRRGCSRSTPAPLWRSAGWSFHSRSRSV
jgi:hypothetical protein